MTFQLYIWKIETLFQTKLENTVCRSCMDRIDNLKNTITGLYFIVAKIISSKVIHQNAQPLPFFVPSPIIFEDK